MRFQVVNIEPKGFRFGHFLDYHCKLICYGLESLGHDCTISCNNLEVGRINILLGAHLLSTPDDVEAITGSGPYVVAQSEIIRPDGLNLLRNKETLEEVYLPLMMGAQAVWEAFPGNLPILRQRGIRAFPTRCGYHPRLEEIHHKTTKEIDFCFFGSITPHRRELLSALKQRGHKLACLFDARHIYRDDLIANAKVNLSPNQGAGMLHLPYGRICFLLNNRALIAVEECRDQQWLEECFASSPTDGWITLCEELIRRPDREELREMYFERYRKMLFTEHLELLLEQTFSDTTAGREMPVLHS